jgi:hypothetical protein
VTDAERAEHTLQALICLFRITPLPGKGKGAK